MSKLPLLSWRDVVKVLSKAGFKVNRTKGRHIILVKNSVIVPVPRHDEIKRGLLIEIISEAGMTKEEFLSLLNRK